MANPDLRIIIGSSKLSDQDRGRLFEKFIETLLYESGYAIKQDLGHRNNAHQIDIIAELPFNAGSIYVECKYGSRTVLANEVYAFIGKIAKWHLDTTRALGLFIAVPGVSREIQGAFRDSRESSLGWRFDSICTIEIIGQDDLIRLAFQSLSNRYPRVPASIISSFATATGRIVFPNEETLNDRWYVSFREQKDNGYVTRVFDSKGEALLLNDPKLKKIRDVDNLFTAYSLPEQELKIEEIVNLYEYELKKINIFDKKDYRLPYLELVDSQEIEKFLKKITVNEKDNNSEGKQILSQFSGKIQELITAGELDISSSGDDNVVRIEDFDENNCNISIGRYHEGAYTNGKNFCDTKISAFKEWATSRQFTDLAIIIEKIISIYKDDKNMRRIDAKENDKLTLNDFKHSIMGNTIGLATLIITKDKMIPLPIRKKVAVYKNLAGCTSSGSWKARSLLYDENIGKVVKESSDQKLLPLLLRGMRAEIAEECSWEIARNLQIWPLAFTRELARAGKPQFFFVAYTNKSLEEFKRDAPQIAFNPEHNDWADSLTIKLNHNNGLISIEQMVENNSTAEISSECIANLHFFLEFINHSESNKSLKKALSLE